MPKDIRPQSTLARVLAIASAALAVVMVCAGCGGSDNHQGKHEPTIAVREVVAAFEAEGIELLVRELPGTEMEAALSPAYQPDVRVEQFDLYVFRDVASATEKAQGGTIEQPRRLTETTVVAHRNVLLTFPVGSGPYSLQTALDAMSHLK